MAPASRSIWGGHPGSARGAFACKVPQPSAHVTFQTVAGPHVPSRTSRPLPLWLAGCCKLSWHVHVRFFSCE
jgi:hypothetical protein